MKTEKLQKNGYLSDGRVTDVEIVEAKESSILTLASLSVTYSDDAPIFVPRHLFLKVYEEKVWLYGVKELAFYNEIASSKDF